MMHGLQDTAKVLRSYYKQYDEHTSDPERLRKRFNAIIDQASEIFGDGLAETAYSKIPLFYSLFGLLYDCTYGLPNSPITPQTIPSSKYQKVASALIELAQYLEIDEPPTRFATFVVACKQQTNNIKPRTTRHKFMWNAITSVL
jgi:hypothetical protein